MWLSGSIKHLWAFLIVWIVAENDKVFACNENCQLSLLEKFKTTLYMDFKLALLSDYKSALQEFKVDMMDEIKLNLLELQTENIQRGHQDLNQDILQNFNNNLRDQLDPIKSKIEQVHNRLSYMEEGLIGMDLKLIDIDVHSQATNGRSSQSLVANNQINDLQGDLYIEVQNIVSEVKLLNENFTSFKNITSNVFDGKVSQEENIIRNKRDVVEENRNSPQEEMTIGISQTEENIIESLQSMIVDSHNSSQEVIEIVFDERNNSKQAKIEKKIIEEKENIISTLQSIIEDRCNSSQEEIEMEFTNVKGIIINSLTEVINDNLRTSKEEIKTDLDRIKNKINENQDVVKYNLRISKEEIKKYIDGIKEGLNTSMVTIIEKQTTAVKPESGCIFPFRYSNGVVYNSCTTTYETKPWCSTYTNSEGTHKNDHWKYCQDSEPCQYPFIDNGHTYHDCSLGWCSTKTDRNNNHIAKYWKICK